MCSIKICDIIKHVILSEAYLRKAEICGVEESHALPEILRLRSSLLRRDELRSG